MNKSTPGPWKSIRDKEFNEIVIKSEKGRKFIASLDLHSIHSGTEENCANARLIAAAPTMKSALDFISDLCKKPCNEGAEVRLRTILANVEIALRKAEGR